MIVPDTLGRIAQWTSAVILMTAGARATAAGDGSDEAAARNLVGPTGHGPLSFPPLGMEDAP